MKLWKGAALAVALAFCGEAHASDTDPCPADMVCANKPQTVVDALHQAGYKAKLGKDKVGDPMVESAAGGYDFTLFFYECEHGRDCASVQFLVSFKADSTNTPALANEWNQKQRFSQMSVDDDGSLDIRLDVNTFGGLNQKNFADTIDWWAARMGELSAFFKAHPAPK